MKLFLDNNKKNDELSYEKKDPMKNFHIKKYVDDEDDLSDVELYAHVEDSAKYVHNLRREKTK